MYKHWIIGSLAVCILFICTLLVVSNHGGENRIFASGKTTYRIDTPEKAYLLWKETKVKGRTLILFDRYPHNMGLISYNGPPQLTKSNFVELSIFQNIIRRIYFIVPEADWIEFRNQSYVRPIREATDVTKGLYLYNQSGIPIIAVTPSSLPHISEEALVYINTRMFNRDEVMELLTRKNISSDIIISLEGINK